jgi:hypothetical protein
MGHFQTGLTEFPPTGCSRSREYQGRPDAAALVRLSGSEDIAATNRLDQPFARSQREIEAHASELAETEPGRYFRLPSGELRAIASCTGVPPRTP